MKRFLALALLLVACSTVTPCDPPAPPTPVTPAAPPIPLDARIGDDGRSIADAIAAAAHRRTAPPDTASRSAARRDATPLPPRIIFGTSYEDLKPITEEQARALKSVGFDIVRPTIPWYKVNPKEREYDWRDVDQNIANMRLAGFEIVPSIAWPPAWASEGKPTYQMYTDGCTRFKIDAQSVMDIEFDTSKEWCVNPPHLYMGRFPFQSAAYQFGAAFGLRHGRSVIAVAIGNEPKSQIYWPPADKPDGMRRYVVEFVEPMTRGIRAVARRMLFVGPEADAADANYEALELERDLGLHLYDIHSIHPYPWHSDWRHVYERIDNEFMPAIEPFREGRPVWYSECGGMPDIVAFVREIVASKRDVAMISVGDFRQWFVAGTWDANRPVLNARGLEMQALIAEVTKGRKMRLHVEMDNVVPFETRETLRRAA